MQTHYWTHNKWKLYWIKIGERPTVILSGFSHVLTLREFREIVVNVYVSLCVCVYFHFSPSELSYLSVGNICFISLCVFCLQWHHRGFVCVQQVRISKPSSNRVYYVRVLPSMPVQSSLKAATSHSI